MRSIVRLSMLLLMTQTLLATSSWAQSVTPAANRVANTNENRIRTQLSARDAVVLSSELAAKIDQLPLREGDSFKHGDLLVSFDCSIYDAQLKKSLAIADSAKKLFAVNKRMAELHSIGELELMQSESKVRESEADVNYMQASVRKCTINAPFNGRVAKRLVANHQYVNMGTPLLDVVDSGQLELQMIVPSRWLAWIKPGQNFNVAIEELGKTYVAKVTQIGARIDPVSQTLLITGKIDTAAPELLAGMSGWASFPQQ